MAEVFVIIGLIGLSGMTVLFPLLAAVAGRQKTPSRLTSIKPQRLAIIIPAHNEGQLIGKTLASLKKTIQKAHNLPLDVRIYVAADGCTDGTVSVACQYDVEILASRTQRGKWLTLQGALSRIPESDWVAFVDVGTEWPSDFLLRISPYFSDPQLMGLAPSYSAEESFVERLQWQVERWLKTLENAAGGPVSFHGATSFFRSVELYRALEGLESEQEWLNDDVVLPLSMRLFFPARRHAYLSDVKVFDRSHDLRFSGTSYVRRRRLAIGNVQWAGKLFPRLCRVHPPAALLALRRVFRIFWAYWVGLFGVGLLFLLSEAVGLSSLFPLTLIALVGLFAVGFEERFRAVLDAARASFAAPAYFVSAFLSPTRVRKGVAWR